MKSKATTFEFQINDHGCPLVTAPLGSFATAQFVPADPEQSRCQIIISANRKGLLTLARWMAALADTESCLDHQHFDDGNSFGFFDLDSDCELIIERVGK